MADDRAMKATRTLDDTTFWNHVDQDESGCWLWTAATTPTGYGQFRFHDGSRAAHRLAYEQMVGPIPDGLELDHLCRVRNCVNPDHLEPVTHAENLRRRVLVRKGGQFHCGFTEHPRTPENTRLKRRAGGDVEQCLTCERARATAKVTCPLCGRKSSAGNLAEHQRTAICQSIREERTP